MKKILMLLLGSLLILSGCIKNTAPLINDENIAPVNAQETTEISSNEQTDTESPSENVVEEALSLEDKMAIIGFYDVSGYYSRTAIEDEAEYVEMFAFEKNTFIRILTNDLEREVLAYDYLSDDFTYIYYFDGELTAKTEMNIGTGAVYEDDGGYAELLTITAEELKVYFSDLMEAAGLSPDELH